MTPTPEEIAAQSEQAGPATVDPASSNVAELRNQLAQAERDERDREQNAKADRIKSGNVLPADLIESANAVPESEAVEPVNIGKVLVALAHYAATGELYVPPTDRESDADREQATAA